MLLAIGHEFVLGSYLGPPLAFWLGEVAFGLAGSLGLYALAQACIVVAYWAIFALGRSIVGTRHAILAVLLMVGIAAFSVPSPNFGPAIMAAPLWALALLYYRRAVGEQRRGYWFLLALVLGLLILASYVGLILFAILIVFTASTARGRAAGLHPEPWIAVLLLCIVVFPHALWLSNARALVMEGIDESVAATGRLSPGTWLCLVLVLTHLGLALLVTLASGWPRHPRERAPEIDRNPVESLARNFVYVFALAPALAAIAVAFASGRLGPLDRVAPLVVLWASPSLSPPATRCCSIESASYRRRGRAAGCAAGAGRALDRGIPVDARGRSQDCPACQRRRPLARGHRSAPDSASWSPIRPVIRGLRRWSRSAAPSRPHVYSAWAPQRSPWASPADVLTQGGILVWPAADNTGTPPATLKAQFPDLVQEVPRSFPRAVQGRLPLIRLGWSMLRPQGAP